MGWGSGSLNQWCSLRALVGRRSGSFACSHGCNLLCRDGLRQVAGEERRSNVQRYHCRNLEATAMSLASTPITAAEDLPSRAQQGRRPTKMPFLPGKPGEGMGGHRLGFRIHAVLVRESAQNKEEQLGKHLRLQSQTWNMGFSMQPPERDLLPAPKTCQACDWLPPARHAARVPPRANTGSMEPW